MELERKKKILTGLIDDVMPVDLFKKLKKINDEEIIELEKDGSIEVIAGYVRLTKIANYHLKSEPGILIPEIKKEL